MQRVSTRRRRGPSVFETYAGIRVRGAMLDEVRNTLDASLGLSQATGTYSGDSGSGKPNWASGQARDIAAEMGVSLEEYFQRMVAAHRLFSLDQEGEDGDMPVHQIHEPDRAQWGTGGQMNSARRWPRPSSPPERKRLVMSARPRGRLYPKEIGQVGATESRVCQIHAQALGGLARARVHEAVHGRTASNSMDALTRRRLRAGLLLHRRRHPEGCRSRLAAEPGSVRHRVHGHLCLDSEGTPKATFMRGPRLVPCNWSRPWRIMRS